MADAANLFDLAATIRADLGDTPQKLTDTQRRVLALADSFKKVDNASDRTSAKTRALGTGLARAGADASQLKGAFAGLSQATAALDGPLGGISGRLSSITSIGAGVSTSAGAIGVAIGALAAITVGAAVGIYKLVTASAEATGHLHDLSQRTNFTVETLSALQHAAKTSGGSIETISSALGLFQKNMEAAAMGQEDMSRLFKVLNIDILDNEKALRQAFDILSKLPAGAQQTALSMKLFGRSGREVMAVFKEAGGDLDKFISKLRDEGLLVTSEMAAKGDKLSDSVTRIGEQFSAVGRQVASEFEPMVQRALNNFSTWLRNSSGELQGAANKVSNLITWASRLNGVLAALTFKPFVIQVQMVASMVGAGWNWLGLGKLIPPSGAPVTGGTYMELDSKTGQNVVKKWGTGPPDTYRDPREVVGNQWGQRAPTDDVSARVRNALSSAGGGRGGGRGGGKTPKDELEPYKRVLRDLQLQLEYFGDETERARVEQQFLQMGIEKLNPKLREQAEAIKTQALTFASAKDKAREYAEQNARFFDLMDGWRFDLFAQEKGWDSLQIEIERYMETLKGLTPLQEWVIRQDLEAIANKQRHADKWKVLADAIKNAVQNLKGWKQEAEGGGWMDTTPTIDKAIGGATGKVTDVILKDLEEKKQKIRQFADEITNMISSALHTGFRDGFKAGMLEFVRGLLQMIESKMLAKLSDAIADAIFGGVSKGSGGKGIGSTILGVLLGGLGGIFGGGGSGSGSMGSGVGTGISAGIGHKAMGGFMSPNEWSWVGERGPELIRAGNQGATVIPNHTTGGGNVFNFNYHAPPGSRVDSRETAAQASKKYQAFMMKPILTG